MTTPSMYRDATVKEIKNNSCSFDGPCDHKIKYRWRGGYFFCKTHFLEEMKDSITSDDSDSSDSDSSESDDSDSSDSDDSDSEDSDSSDSDSSDSDTDDSDSDSEKNEDTVKTTNKVVS
jgi:hypothetical protein